MSEISDKQQVRYSRWLTIFWGVVATGFALRMIGGSETVLELVNKIGSAFYGPILATFWLGMLTKRGTESGAISGLILGVGFNIFLWQFYGNAVSWLWWNVFGFGIAFGLGYLLSLNSASKPDLESYSLSVNDFKMYLSDKKYYFALLGVFVFILLSSFILQDFIF